MTESLTPLFNRVRVAPAEWCTMAQTLRDAGGDLLALWGAESDTGGFRIWAAIQDSFHVTVLELPWHDTAVPLPSLTPIFPCALRMERGLRDLLGVAVDIADRRPWLRHGHWIPGQFPLRRAFATTTHFPVDDDNYAFVSVAGAGVHEMGVGPVHAGVIEPGRFRFSIVGEKVLRLEEQLGYVHRGLEKRLEGRTADDGQALAARTCGDSTVAFSWAYCMAWEDLCGLSVPPRALYLRAWALERERIANHLGDLGALGGDAGFAVGLAQFSRLKEDLLRTNAMVLGARYPMDFVVPGGVACDRVDEFRAMLATQTEKLDRELRLLREVYDQHGGLQDRFIGCGQVTTALAQRLGIVGLSARASGKPGDVRCNMAYPPYDQVTVQRVGHKDGDVAARVSVRFDEALESLRLCRVLLAELPAGEVRRPLGPPAEGALAIGLVEGWRGPVLVALEVGGGGRIRRCHLHDPSWQNWPAVEHAILDNMVADFPLINKSFNLSYSGHDL